MRHGECTAKLDAKENGTSWACYRTRADMTKHALQSGAETATAVAPPVTGCSTKCSCTLYGMMPRAIIMACDNHGMRDYRH